MVERIEALAAVVRAHAGLELLPFFCGKPFDRTRRYYSLDQQRRSLQYGGMVAILSLIYRLRNRHLNNRWHLGRIGIY